MRRSQFSKFAFLLVILLLCFPGCTSYWSCGKTVTVDNADSGSDEEEKPMTFPDEKAAAENGMEILSELVAGDDPKEMGFNSTAEMTSATLGVPLKVFLVRCDQLIKYENGSDPSGLLTDVQRSVYPVMVGGQTRSSIIVEKQNGGWSAISFGDANLILKIVEARTALSAKFGTPASEVTVIHVACLDTYFVGLKAANTLTLRNATLLEGTSFAAPVTMPAAGAFSILAPLAREEDAMR